jgi:small subunit ribosomal protein S15e
MTTAVAALRKKRQFRKFTFRGLELEKILDLNQEELLEVVHARARRRMLRGMKKKRHVGLLNKLKKAKKAAGALDKPAPVKTHLRNMVIVPDLIGSQVAIYNGKVFNLVLITADMLGSYLGEYSITYRPVRHGRPGLGSTNSSRFIPLK